MTTRELDQLWERFDKLEDKVEQKVDTLQDSFEKKFSTLGERINRLNWLSPLMTVAAAILAIAAKKIGLF